MNQEKIGKFIKEIRINNNLSQQQLANKLGVSSQAVSKWENGKNIPDILILKQISEKFNLNIDDILNGEVKEKDNDNLKNENLNNKYKIIIFSLLFLITIFTTIFFFISRENDYQFKILSSNCDSFKIKGTLSYNNQKSSIYISNIEYCGGDDTNVYKKIECALYERNNDTITKIFEAKTGSNKTLENYLENVLFSIDNYNRICKNFDNRSLYLEINATNENDKIIKYHIPLNVEKTLVIK